MTAALRHWAACAIGGRGVLAPIAALLVVLTGVYAYRPNDVESTWALTALLACPLTAWLTTAVLRSEPGPQREMVEAARGGAHVVARLRAGLGALLAAGVAGVLIAHPLVIGAFDRAVPVDGVALGALAHLACGLVGAAVGILASPPTCERAAHALTLVLGALLASAALAATPVPAGPADVATAYADAAGRLTGELGLALAGGALWLAAAEAARRVLAARR